MTKLKDMLEPAQVAALAAAKAKATPKPTPPAEPEEYQGKHALPYDPALDQEPVLLEEYDDLLTTEINGVLVDLRSDGFHACNCADCGVDIEVEIKPEGVDLGLLIAKPRVSVCLECGQKRVAGKQGVVVHSPARYVDAEPPTREKKEEDVDLTKYSKAQFAAIAVQAREDMVARAAAELPKKRKKAKRKEAERIAKDEALKAKEREARKDLVLAGFTVEGKVIPTLDLSAVSNLHEILDAEQRSPYNKALHALKRDLLKPEEATFEAVAALHVELQGIAATVEPEPKSAKAKKAKKGKGKKRLLAELAPEAKAKVEALASVKGITFDEARQHLAARSLI